MSEQASEAERKTLIHSDGTNGLFINEGGGVGMDVGGRVIVKPISEWHRLAALDAAERTPARKALDIAGLRARAEAASRTYVGGGFPPDDALALLDRLEAAEGKVGELTRELEATKSESDGWKAAHGELLDGFGRALAGNRIRTITDIASALAGRGDKKCAEFVAGMKEKGE